MQRVLALGVREQAVGSLQVVEQRRLAGRDKVERGERRVERVGEAEHAAELRPLVAAARQGGREAVVVDARQQVPLHQRAAEFLRQRGAVGERDGRQRRVHEREHRREFLHGVGGRHRRRRGVARHRDAHHRCAVRFRFCPQGGAGKAQRRVDARLDDGVGERAQTHVQHARVLERSGRAGEERAARGRTPQAERARAALHRGGPRLSDTLVQPLPQHTLLRTQCLQHSLLPRRAPRLPPPAPLLPPLSPDRRRRLVAPPRRQGLDAGQGVERRQEALLPQQGITPLQQGVRLQQALDGRQQVSTAGELGGQAHAPTAHPTQLKHRGTHCKPDAPTARPTQLKHRGTHWTPHAPTACPTQL